MKKRILSDREERGLTDGQKNYLNAHPSMVSLQPHSMLPPREQLYKTLLHGAVTIDRAMELDAQHRAHAARRVNTANANGPFAFDSYSNDEDTFMSLLFLKSPWR